VLPWSSGGRQIRIEEAEGVRWLDHADPGGTLLIDYLVTQRLHPGPMDLWPEMMLGVVTVIKPDPVIELVIAAHAPRNRLVRISAVMPVVPVQIRQAVAKVPKRQKKTDVTPVQNAQDDESSNKRCEFEDSPKRLARIFPFQFLENGLGIFAEETEERVCERTFGFTVLAVFINRNPIDSFALVVRAVGVSLVMPHVNAFVENLAKTDRDRLQDAKQTIEQRRAEIRIVNEVVGNAVDVPGNADRIDETENHHDPKGNPWKKKKHAEEVNAVQEGCGDRDRVPLRVRKNL